MDLFKELKLPTRAEKALRAMGIETMDQFLALRVQDLRNRHRVGGGTIKDIIDTQRAVEAGRKRMRFHRSGGFAFPSESGRGMTLRHWYAGMALQGLLSSRSAAPGNSSAAYASIVSGETAEAALAYADALIAKERETIPDPKE